MSVCHSVQIGTTKKEEFRSESVKEKKHKESQTNEREKEKDDRDKEIQLALTLRTLLKSCKGHVLLDARHRRTCS